MMNRIAALVAFFCMSPVFALGLGEVEGSAVIGRPLRVTIPLLGSQGDTGQTACTSLLHEGDADTHEGIRIKVVGDRIHLSTTQALTQPIIRFRIRLGCSGPFERSFVVLSDPAKSVVSVPSAASVAPAPVAGDMPAVLPRAEPAASGQRSIVLMSSTSLRMLSRQRYPGDSSLRVSFIRQLAAANPDLFASEEAAFDQRLAAGTRLLMPVGLPAPQRAASARAVSAKPGPETGTGRGRLIVGAAGLSAAGGPSTAELSESIDRMIEVMNQQIMVQIALTERIKTTEAELAELKRQVGAEKARTAQREAELKLVREAAERNGVIQWLLVILLGGVAGAWVLGWMSRRKTAAAMLPVAAAVSSAPTLVPRNHARPMPQASADPLDQRDDILPPGGLR
jgi:hypothetical protein